ncbi:large membrane associated channel [Cryptosporidium canis]|nr:large membrane associated channel [Cryptosporidium canis]
MTILQSEMYKGNSKGLLRQHRMVGEFLECTYIEHKDPYSKDNDAEAYRPGTGNDRSKSRVVSLELIDTPLKITNTLECQESIIRSWIADINKTLKDNMFSVMEVRSWRHMIRSQSLSLEVDQMLTILENKNPDPLKKVKEAVAAFEKYTTELREAYLDFKNSEDKLKDASSDEERRTRAQVAVLNLGQKENKSLAKLTGIVRHNAKEIAEVKRIIEKLFPLLSSESCSNRILNGLELVQICFFLLNGLNILSVFEEQRLQSKFRRDMARRSLIYQNKIEEKTLLKYPRFSNAPNFKEISDFLWSSVKKSTDLKDGNKNKHEFIQKFDEIVGNFGIRCPYFLTSVSKSGDANGLKGREMFDQSIVKNCRLAWKEISSYLYKEGQIVPSAAIRQALKKSLNKHSTTVYIWPRNAVSLYKKIHNSAEFENSFDISNERKFISTCSETLNAEIGFGTVHSVSLDEIAIICFNFFNILEFYVEQYNYGQPEEMRKGGSHIRATNRHVNMKTLPSTIKAKALDLALSGTLDGVIDHPPFKPNDLDRAVVGILTENFVETCTQRLETVLGKASKYRISNPQEICKEARTILKNYNIMSQSPDIVEGSMDIFDQFNILDTSLELDINRGKSEELDSAGYSKLIQSKLDKLQQKSISYQSKDVGVSPIKQLDPVKAYNLIRKMHYDWMDQMKSDPRYKGFTDLELKNNSPWIKQIKLWHNLIAPELPEIKYAASYLNNRPSRFPLISGDKRGKQKRITPLEELLSEGIDPKYRARYSLVENGPFEEQEFYYDDQYEGYDENSVADELAKTREYFIKGKDGSYIKNRKGNYILNRNGSYTKVNRGKYKGYGGGGRTEHSDTEFYTSEGEMEYYSSPDQHREQIIAVPIGSSKKSYSNLIKLEGNKFVEGPHIDDGCKGEELPLRWGQRATVLFKNMMMNFKQVRYRGKSGPGGFVTIDDICYIMERDFKVKRNFFDDISKVNLMVCEGWFSAYLSELWPPFSMGKHRLDIKALCWESGFRGWL